MSDALTPGSSDLPPTPRAPASGWRRLVAWCLRLIMLAWLLGAGAVLVVRHVLMPAVGDFRDDIAAAVTASLGVEVSIAAVEGRWAGWRPRLLIENLRIADADGRPALVLPKVDATLAWSSLLRLQPHFHRLDIAAAELDVRREADGTILVAGLVADTSGGEEGRGLEWLLAQRQIVVHDSRLRWTDKVRGAPALELDQLEFRLDQRASPARFALQARPQQALASTLVVRGELDRLELPGAAQAGELEARMYVELERADLGAWTAWIDYPLPLAGHGGVRAWFEASAGGALDMTADVVLDGVVATLAPGLPELAVSHLDGRLSLQRKLGLLRLSGQQLALRTVAGLAVAPTDFDVQLRKAPDGAQAGGSVTASHLDLAALAGLVAYLPVDEGVRARLAGLAPHGRVDDLSLSWDGDSSAPQAWRVRARFAELGLLARDGLPGLGGVSGTIDGDQRGGRYRIDARTAHLDLPDVFESGRLAFDRLRAEGSWLRRERGLEIALDGAEFDNIDAAGTASGRYWPGREGAGEIDLQARLSRAEGTAVWRYLPRVVNRHTHDWVRTAIRAAVVPEARLRLRGRLADFPFRDGDGTFLVSIRVEDALLDYAPGWPSIEGIHGEVRFEGPGMRILAERGRVLGVDLAGVVADVPDLDQRPTELMTITGQARGATADFLRFVSASPVSRRIGGFTDGMRAEGKGELELKLVMPLRSVVDTTVEGEYRFAANRIALVEGLPALERAAGRVRFTADSLAIPEARAQLFGHPLRLSARTATDGSVRFEAAGKADAAALRAAYDIPLLDGLSGTAAWSTSVLVGKDGTRLEVSSDLLGVASSLPPPVNKPASESWPLKLAVSYPAGQAHSELVLGLGGLVRAELQRSDGQWTSLSGGVALGRATADAVPRSSSGVAVAGVLDGLDLDAWRRVLDAGDDDGTDAVAERGGDGLAALPLAAVALAADELTAFGHRLRAVDLRAVPDQGGWTARIDSDLAAGELDWRSAGSGALAARLRFLRIGAADAQSRASGTEAAEARIGDTPPRRLPALDVVAERFELRGMDLGRLEVLARNRGGLWELDRFAIANDDGRLSGSGQWLAAGRQRTRMEFSFDTADVGRFSRRIGYPDVVRGGQAALSGELGWQGAPTAIDYASLAGRLQLEAGAGQFNKLEPGVGRLLGILSLQSLPRRITLDFRDVFSEGFAFDRISGSIDVTAGVMRTDDLEIRGPAARVRMSGTTDLVAETQDLRVIVQPTLSESIAIGAAAGLLNPAVGVVTYLAQKVLSDPIEKLFAFEYAVTGSWVDPQVAKRGNVELPPAQ